MSNVATPDLSFRRIGVPFREFPQAFDRSVDLVVPTLDEVTRDMSSSFAGTQLSRDPVQIASNGCGDADDKHALPHPPRDPKFLPHPSKKVGSWLCFTALDLCSGLIESQERLKFVHAVK
jgi:hypothetical protein